MFIYLYGLPAAGQYYVGQVLAEEFGHTFYDGDRDLTPELRAAVRDQRPCTDPRRDRFYAILIERIAALRRGDACRPITNLAFGQATFKERHRAQIAAAFPDVIFVLVEADEAVRLARLAGGDNPVTVDYARHIAAYFGPPAQLLPRYPHFVIRNEGDRAAVVAQLAALLFPL